jgi:hypothetical protein
MKEPTKPTKVIPSVLSRMTLLWRLSTSLDWGEVQKEKRKTEEKMRHAKHGTQAASGLIATAKPRQQPLLSGISSPLPSAPQDLPRGRPASRNFSIICVWRSAAVLGSLV